MIIFLLAWKLSLTLTYLLLLAPCWVFYRHLLKCSHFTIQLVMSLVLAVSWKLAWIDAFYYDLINPVRNAIRCFDLIFSKTILIKILKNLLLIFLSLLIKSFKETCIIRRHYAMIRPVVILPIDIHNSQLNTSFPDP